MQALRAQGKGIKPVMRELGLAKETVRRFYRASGVDELLAKTRDRKPSILDEHKPCLHQRWNDGCTNVWQLHAEIRARGYRGGYGTVRDYLQPFRALAAAPPPRPAPPKVRDVTGWMLRDHDAVLNGLTLPWSSGAVEGNVNLIKMIKRQMYGRATFDLLRNESSWPDPPGRDHHEIRVRSSFHPSPTLGFPPRVFAQTDGARSGNRPSPGPHHR